MVVNKFILKLNIFLKHNGLRLIEVCSEEPNLVIKMDFRNHKIRIKAREGDSKLEVSHSHGGVLYCVCGAQR